MVRPPHHEGPVRAVPQTADAAWSASGCGTPSRAVPAAAERNVQVVRRIVDSEMCHRRQKSDGSSALYGESKFWGIRSRTSGQGRPPCRCSPRNRSRAGSCSAKITASHASPVERRVVCGQRRVDERRHGVGDDDLLDQADDEERHAARKPARPGGRREVLQILPRSGGIGRSDPRPAGRTARRTRRTRTGCGSA